MAALAAAVLMSMAVAPVAAQTPRGDVPIHIEAQPLADALLQLGRQTSLQLYFPPELVTGKRAPAVNGTMRPEAALDSLLKGSGIQYQRSGNQGFVLRPVSAAPAAAPPVPSNTLHATAQPTTVLAAVEVTASRTSSDLVRPTRQSTVLERTELEELKTGSDSLATVLSKVIPGMADSSHTVTDFGQTLRGRGMLVLLDGIPLNTNRDSARNLANIDPALVERVEVLRGSSAIYGGGATG
ncbi:MAG: TonB-dependent receptor, partial [Pseudomonadota bacterium]